MSFYIFVALLILAALIICIPDDVYSFVRDLVDFNFPNLSSERSNINHNNNEPPVITHLACAICAENISPSDSLSVTRCGHMFHTACIATWLDQVENCPHCRTRCPRESMVRVYLNVSTDDQIPISAQAVIDDLQTNLKETQTRLSQREAEMETISEAHNAARKRIVDLHAHIDQAHSILQVSMKLVSKYIYIAFG